MRWFHWTVEQFMEVYNPPNAEVLTAHLLILVIACPYTDTSRCLTQGSQCFTCCQHDVGGCLQDMSANFI